MLGLLVIFGTVGTLQPGQMAGHIHHCCLHAIADAKVRQSGFPRIFRGQHLAFETAIAKPAGHQYAIHASQHLRRAFALHVFGFQPLQRHLGALANAAVLERFAHRFIGVLVIHIFADHGNGDGIIRVAGGIDHRIPFGQICLGRRQMQLIHHDLIQRLRMEPAWNLVDVVQINGRDHRLFRHIGEQRDLAALALGQRLFATANQHVRLNANTAQFLHRMLGGLGFEFAGGSNVGHQGQVHEHRLVGTALGTQLADGFQKRQRFDIAHSAANFDDTHIKPIGGGINTGLDLIRHMRDHLHGAAQIITAPLLADHRLVNLARGDRVQARQPRVDEALVVAQVKVGFRAVVGDIHLAVLERAHGARIHVQIRVKLHHGDAQTTRLKDGGKRGSGNTLAKRRHHAPGNKEQGRMGIGGCHVSSAALETRILAISGGKLPFCDRSNPQILQACVCATYHAAAPIKPNWPCSSVYTGTSRKVSDSTPLSIKRCMKPPCRR